MTQTTSTLPAVDWQAIAERMLDAIAANTHGPREALLYGADLYAHALREALGAQRAFAGHPGEREILYGTHGLRTEADHRWTLDSHLIVERHNRETAERTVRELRAEIQRLYREARADMAAALREYVGPHNMPSRYRREGWLAAADWLDGKAGA